MQTACCQRRHSIPARVKRVHREGIGEGRAELHGTPPLAGARGELLLLLLDDLPALLDAELALLVQDVVAPVERLPHAHLPVEERDYKGLHSFPSNITRDDPPSTRDCPPSLLRLQGSWSRRASRRRRAPKERDYKGLHAFPSDITRDGPPITRDCPPSLLTSQGRRSYQHERTRPRPGPPAARA